MYIALILGIIAVIGIGAVIFFKGAAPNLTIIDVISAETVITFFKRPDVVEKLRQNNNLLAVAVKDDTQNIITLACFNKETTQ